LEQAGQLDWSRASIDSVSVRAKARRGRSGAVGPNPAARGKSGAKRHQVVDRRGMPLGVRLSRSNVPDGKRMLETVDAVDPVRGGRGPPPWGLERHPQYRKLLKRSSTSR